MNDSLSTSSKSTDSHTDGRPGLWRFLISINCAELYPKLIAGGVDSVVTLMDLHPDYYRTIGIRDDQVERMRQRFPKSSFHNESLYRVDPYAPAAGAEQPRRRYKRQPESDPHAPKKPRTAYLIFSQKIRSEMPGASFAEISAMAGERWSAMSEEMKQPLEQAAIAQRTLWHSAQRKYEHSEEYADYQRYLEAFRGQPSAPEN